MATEGYVKGELKSSRFTKAKYWWERNGGFVIGAVIILTAVETHKRFVNLEKFVDVQETFNRDLSVWKGLVMDALDADEIWLGDLDRDIVGLTRTMDNVWIEFSKIDGVLDKSKKAS